MKGPVTAYIGWLLLAGIFGFYAYGLGKAIQLSWTGNIVAGSYPEALSTTISSIQALLLTNLGALLGISVTKPQSSIARAMMLYKAPVAGPGPGPAQMPAPPDPLQFREKIQLAALIIYIVALILCLITWIHSGFLSDSTQILDLVSQSGKMFLGVALAYVTTIISR